MRMYVGNATKQHQDFIYSIKDPTGVLRRRMQRIEIGQQVLISGELERDQIDMIIRDHVLYGFVPVSEIDHVREHVGLCYSIGPKPIPASAIHQLMQHNAMILAERGKQTRKESALAGNEHLEASLAQAGRQERLNHVETTIIEENHDERDETPALAEGYKIQRTAADAPVETRRGRRARK